ncbi:MAG: hypothetical protein ACRETU_03080 [Steroidobacterales bacterium]
MPGFVLTVASTVQCTHGGTATAVPSNTSVQADSSPVLVESDTHTVAGCSFNVSGSPMPCVTIAWSAGATKVKINGTAVLVKSSVGQCKNGAGVVQGMAIVASTQTKVSAQ